MRDGHETNESEPDSEVGTNSGVCTKSLFQDMKRQGSSLKRAKRINPVPRRADMDHYRDVKAQNDWLHSNIFISSISCHGYY